uniref:Uncharacterized protein n=1 Tax=Rhizophora mucronata TaxID=61149 RepID=A0A2P2M9Y1_RHIMU
MVKFYTDKHRNLSPVKQNSALVYEIIHDIISKMLPKCIFIIHFN